METERITLSQRERDRLRVLQEVERGHLTQREAAGRIHLCDRQVRRLLLRLQEQGDRGGDPRITRTTIVARTDSSGRLGENSFEAFQAST